MYEFHGIKWLNDDELDADSPERRGPGWAHAYVPVIGPEGSATGTAHVPIYMPRIYKELKRFALQIYKAAGGTTGDVEFSGWWSDVKKGFKKMVKVVAKNKVLRTLAEKGLEAAVPGGSGLSEGAAKVAEDLIAKYRGGQKEAAGQIKGFLEQANKGDDTAAKVVDALRREYVKQQGAGLPALLKTMVSGDVVVYDPIVGAKRKMTKQQQKKVNQSRKRQAAARAKQQKQGAGPTKRTSPLRSSPQGPKQPGARAIQMRDGMLQPGVNRQVPGSLLNRPGMLQPNLPGLQYPGAQYPGAQYPGQYPQQYPSDYGPASYGPQDGGGSYFDPEQDADDEADLQAAAEENMARMYSAEDLEAEDEAAMAGAEYYDVGYDPSKQEYATFQKLTPEERAQLKKMSKKDGKAFLKQKGFEKTQAARKRDRDKSSKLNQAQRKIQEMQRSQGERAKRASMIAKAKLRFQQQKEEYTEQLRGLEAELHDRDLADDKRAALEAQKAAYQDRLEQADKDLIKADLEEQKLEYAHRETMAKIRAAMPEATAPAAPPLYDEERGEEYDTDDPLVREALAHMQAAAEVEQADEE